MLIFCLCTFFSGVILSWSGSTNQTIGITGADFYRLDIALPVPNQQCQRLAL